MYTHNQQTLTEHNELAKILSDVYTPTEHQQI